MDESTIIQQEQAAMMGRTAYTNPQDNAGLNSLLSELLNVDNLIEKVELQLQGLDYNEEGQTVKVCEPLVNREGAKNMIRLMMAYVNNITQLSNFEEDQIRVMIQELGFDIVEDCIKNKIRYQLNNTNTDLTQIRQIVLSTAFSCCMGALDNGMRQMLKKTAIETSVNVQGQQMPKSKGGIGSILGIGRK